MQSTESDRGRNLPVWGGGGGGDGAVKGLSRRLPHWIEHGGISLNNQNGVVWFPRFWIFQQISLRFWIFQKIPRGFGKEIKELPVHICNFGSSESEQRRAKSGSREQEERRSCQRESRVVYFGEGVMAEDDSIGEAAEARRERLRALRKAQELFETPDEGGSQAENGDAANDESLNMKFRNYLPQDKELQEGRLAPPDLPKFEDPVAPVPVSEKKEDPFLNIAPKKPNWDLRRDVQKKLDKLERKTQKALFKLMEEQEKEKQSENAEMATEED